MHKLLVRFARDESGATAIEYGLIAALLAVSIVAVLKSVRGELQGTFADVETSLQDRN